MSYAGVWREPAEETVGPYPNGRVHDGRGAGSLMIGYVAPWWVVGDTDWDVSDWSSDPKLADEMRAFVYHLLNVRGEFARLLLVLANAERTEDHTNRGWWESKRQRKAVTKALRNCIEVLAA